MNKKIFGIVTVFLIAAILATPVFAGPEKGQKVPITIYWEPLDNVLIERRDTGIVRHLDRLVNWSISIDVNGVPTYTGFANNTERKVTRIPGPDDLATQVLQETYDMKITGYEGGFKGSALIMLDRVGGDYSEYRAKAHGLLHGYGEFEGQTINAGHHWLPIGDVYWEGYLLQK